LEKIFRDDDATMLFFGHFQKPARDVDGIARGGDLLLGRRTEPRQNRRPKMQADPEIQLIPGRRADTERSDIWRPCGAASRRAGKGMV
jgi:hypothetical protein